MKGEVRKQPLFDDEFLKKLEYLHIISKKVFTGRLRAERKTRIVGSGIEFADYRQYTAGDDFRYIDWAVLARTERLLIRLFEEEEDLHVYFLVDVSQSMRIGGGRKLRYAKRLAAALGFVGLANHDRVSVVPFAQGVLGRLPPSRGRRQIFKIFRFLERDFGEAKETDLAAAFRTFVGQNKRRGLVVVISDFYDVSGFEEALNVLRFGKFETMVCHVLDEADLEPSLFGDLELVDCETGEAVSITVTRDLIRAYQREHEEIVKEVEEFCRRKNLLCFRGPVSVTFEDLVLQVFRAGGLPAMTFLGITSGLFWTLLAALGAALAVMYLFRLRRRRVEVPYGALWSRVLAQRTTRRWWHRLKRWLSLLLQLVVLLLILLALRDPRPADFEVDARHVVLVVDTSASMATLDLPGGRDRIEAAREAALAFFDDLGAEDQVMILRMDGEVRPLTDFGRPTAMARQRLADLTVTATGAELPGTIRFAARALAGRTRPELVLISDGAFGEAVLAEAGAIDLPSGTAVSVVPVGQATGNVGITAFNARRYPLDRRNFEVFVQVASTFESPVTVELTLRAGGRAVDQRLLEVPPDGSVERFYPNLARGHRRLNAHIEVVGSDNNDLFALDNEAFALLPRDRALNVLLISEPNLFVEAPLLLSPNVELTPWRAGPGAPPTPDQMAGFDVVVTNGQVPPLPARGNFLTIAPSGEHSPFSVEGTTSDPIIDRVAGGDPLLRYVAGLDDLNIRQAARLDLASGDRAVARSIRGHAMIARRGDADRRVVAIAFPIEASDFGLRLAYPLVVLNAIDWLTTDEATLIEGLRTGRAARLFVPEAGVSAAWVRAPNGALQRFEVVDRYVPVYPEWPGFYEVFWESEARASAGPESLRAAIDGGSVSADQVVAANLLEPDERRIAAAAELPFEASAVSEEVEQAGLLAGREPWTVLILVALVVLLVEWWTYNRRMTV